MVALCGRGFGGLRRSRRLARRSRWGAALQPDDRVRVDFDDVQLTFDVEKGAAEAMEEVEEPESQPAHV